MFCMEELASGPQGGEDTHPSRGLERTQLQPELSPGLDRGIWTKLQSEGLPNP